MIDPSAVQEFLSGRRLALVGASADPQSFSNTIFHELKTHGYDVVPVNPNVDSIDGVPAYKTVAEIPNGIDRVMVMVRRENAAQVVHDCVDHGIHKIWLFKGIGAGSVSDEAVDIAREAGAEVIPGACPLMFLEPVAWFHRLHRAARRMNGSLAKAS